MGVKVNGGAVKKATFPSQRDKLRVVLGLQSTGLRVEPYARPRIEKRLAQALDAHFRHLDPAGGGTVLEILGLHDVLRADHGDRQLLVRSVRAAVVGILVLDDLTNILREVIDRARDLDGEQVFGLPGLDTRPTAEDFEEATLIRDMGGDCHATLLANVP